MTSTDSKLTPLLAANRKIAETWPIQPTMDYIRSKSAETGGGLVVRTFALRLFWSSFMSLQVYAD